MPSKNRNLLLTSLQPNLLGSCAARTGRERLRSIPGQCVEDEFGLLTCSVPAESKIKGEKNAGSNAAIWERESAPNEQLLPSVSEREEKSGAPFPGGAKEAYDFDAEMSIFFFNSASK